MSADTEAVDDDIDLCGCGDSLIVGEAVCPACRDIEALFPKQQIDGEPRP